MDRSRAVRLIEQLLANLDAGGNEDPLDRVAQVFVFGSFARGAHNPHDIDLAVELVEDGDEEFAIQAIGDLTYGRDPYRHIRRALIGGSRQFQIQYNQLARMTAPGNDFTMTVLWQRGDSLDTSLARLHAIATNPEAGRAPRDWMLPAFDGLDRWIPRPVRKSLYQAVHANLLQVDRLDLTDRDVLDPDVWDVLATWEPGSETHRAATAAIAHYERRHVPTSHIRVSNTRFGDVAPRYFVDIRWRRFHRIPITLAKDSTVEWLEILRVLTSAPMPALRLRPRDREALAEVTWNTE